MKAHANIWNNNDASLEVSIVRELVAKFPESQVKFLRTSFKDAYYTFAQR